jgi:hypothetical protein
MVHAYQESGQGEQAIPHQQFLRSCLRSVHESGFGTNFRTAYFVISLDEEYQFLNFFGVVQGFEYRGNRRTVDHEGHLFDVFEVHWLKTGQVGEIYFNIDLIRKGVDESRAELPSGES